jgi:hypothetical protein
MFSLSSLVFPRCEDARCANHISKSALINRYNYAAEQLSLLKCATLRNILICQTFYRSASIEEAEAAPIFTASDFSHPSASRRPTISRIRETHRVCDRIRFDVELTRPAWQKRLPHLLKPRDVAPGKPDTIANLFQRSWMRQTLSEILAAG